MNNEIGRKITSLTLMTIMLAGGMTFAAPSMMPVAHAANANLFVSAENSQFNNYMSGPQVIEVVIIDSTINDTNEGKGEPDVTINGKQLRMVQAVDGNWYGYFADRNMALIADSTATTAGQGLDFGVFCSAASGTATLGVATTETVGFAIGNTTATAGELVIGNSTGVPITATCDGVGHVATTGTVNGTKMNVLRETKEVNLMTGVSGGKIGQIGLATTQGATGKTDIWPFIQLYSLNPTGNVVIQYNKGGGVQTTTLTFDTVDQFAGVSLDKTTFTQLSQVHATITDLWLNIDPTDEDSWTFGTRAANTTSVGTYYQVFDSNGGLAGANVAGGSINIASSLGALMCEDNCRLLVDTNKQGAAKPVLTIQDNDDTVLVTTATTPNVATSFRVGGAGGSQLLGAGSVPVTITEVAPNTGIFGTYDESDKSVLKITSDAARGTSATIDYNATPRTVLVGFNFATIDMQPVDNTWTSGEEIPVILVDGDANKNSRNNEDLDLFNPEVTLIPALSTGDPFTIGEAGLSMSTTTFSGGADALFINFTASGSAYNANAGTLVFDAAATTVNVTSSVATDKYSERAILTQTATAAGGAGVNATIIDFNTSYTELLKTIRNPIGGNFHGFNFINLDVRSIQNTGTVDVYLLNSSDTNPTSALLNATGKLAKDRTIGALLIANDVGVQSLTLLNATANNSKIFKSGATIDNNQIGVLIAFNSTKVGTTQPAGAIDAKEAIVFDFLSFGFLNDGLQENERIANQIVRLELEETGDNTSTFAGSLEFVMINQINILDRNTYLGLSTIADDPTFIVIDDLDDADSPRVNYNDLGADGVTTQVSDQQAAGSHSGVVSFNSKNYKVADTVTITLQDLDLNVDSDLIDIYTVVSNSGTLKDVVGSNSTSIKLSTGDDLGRILDVNFDDVKWTTPSSGTCLTALSNAGIDTGLGATGFTLVETGAQTGIFVGDFQIPAKFCRSATASAESVTGLDLFVNYVDFRDASGEVIEVGDGAGVRANTGSVSLDRTVYPVPWGIPSNFATADITTPGERSVFPIHQTGQNTAGTARASPTAVGGGTGTAGLDSGEFLANGDLTIQVRVNDPDFDVSATGEDFIAQNTTSKNPAGPVKVSISRGSSVVVLGYAGGPAVLPGLIDVDNNNVNGTRQFGPMSEIAPDAGVFEADIVIRYTDGPSSSVCPPTTVFTNTRGTTTTAVGDRFDAAPTSGQNFCILQGDILQVQYTDPTDAGGNVNTVTDSATFDLRNGVLQSDKSVYIIGSDMILTLIEPDFDLNSDQAETYDLDLIEWDSDAATVTMGDADGQGAAFDPEPSNFRETGDSTGIFQIVIEIPKTLAGDRLERGEEIQLEYTDWGPSGSDFVGDEDEDVNLTIFTSNFGATVELDQKVYTWTDKVYITIVAPDHNFDSNLVDEIGATNDDPIKVSTRGNKLNNYKLVETGTDTGIFTGEVILTGFTHNADGDSTTGTSGNDVTTKTPSGNGPTDGLLTATNNDGISVAFEFSEDETVVGSALIRWNIGEVQWLEASYSAKGTGVVRIIDPDMNLNPEAVDNFSADVWSDSDAGGIDLTVTETNEATGIFEGTVFFTVTDESSGHRLRVAEGDTVTAEYSDNTLPAPYTTADELDITATTLIGTIVPPLERAPAANLRIVDAFGNSLSTVNVDQQVQITADLANGQDREQAFAYLVQIQDGNGVTVSLAWITGSLSAGQSFSPALSWIPTDAGTYTATAFVWESVDNPTALSPPVTTTIIVK